MMFKECGMVYAIDYPWTELYGQARPPACNEKTMGLAQPRVASRGGVNPAATTGMAGVRQVKAKDIRADILVSFPARPHQRRR